MDSMAVILARVSSKEQEETGYSLDAQERFLREYAGAKQFSTKKVFRIAETASKAHVRKVFGEIFEYTDKNDVKILLCEKIDRFTRNLKDAAIVDDWVRAVPGREVHFVKENFILNAHTPAHENLVWNMKVSIARFYADNLSEEVRKGQKEKIRQGWLPTKPPLGYKTIGDKGHKIHVPDESVAPFLTKMFEYYASGNYSLSALVEKMWSEGLRTRQGKKLPKSRLDDMLNDPFYYGAMRWKGEQYEAKHVPLVSKELFDHVQELKRRGNAPHFKRHQFAFSKKMRCGECSGSVTAEIQKGIVYYHCNHYRGCTQKPYTAEKDVEAQLMQVFDFFGQITPAEAEEIKSRIKADHAQEIAYKETTLKTLNERYVKLQSRLDVLYNDRLDNVINADTWQKKQREIAAEQADIQTQIATLKSDEAKYFEIWLNILDLARRAREIYTSPKRTPDQKRQLLSLIFSNLTLKDKNVSYTLVEPVAVLSKRLHERLAAQKSFELRNTRVKQGQKGSTRPKNSSLLRG